MNSQLSNEDNSTTESPFTNSTETINTKYCSTVFCKDIKEMIEKVPDEYKFLTSGNYTNCSLILNHEQKTLKFVDNDMKRNIDFSGKTVEKYQKILEDKQNSFKHTLMILIPYSIIITILFIIIFMIHF